MDERNLDSVVLSGGEIAGCCPTGFRDGTEFQLRQRQYVYIIGGVHCKLAKLLRFSKVRGNKRDGIQQLVIQCCKAADKLHIQYRTLVGFIAKC